MYRFGANISNSIGDVADALNFSSMAHFSAAFKRAYGMPSLAYK
ncbi:MAG: AraC family transcriptional regulator [Lachnospiraceae bacterium]|nr:AraC family transcriptional regulator [Lachnospiraceae bacterium]